MKNERARKILAETPAEVHRFVELAASIQIRLKRVLAESNMSQKDMAELLGRKPAEISKWLSGSHNFTLKTLALIESRIGVSLVEVDAGSRVYMEGREQHYKTVIKSNERREVRSMRRWEAASVNVARMPQGI